MSGADTGLRSQQEAQRYPHGEGGGNYPGILIIVIVVVIDELCVICHLDAECGCGCGCHFP